MTWTVLASFSFLALVVTARPILPESSQSDIISKQDAEVQDAVHAYFQSRTGGLPTPDEDIRVHLTSPSEQQAFISQIQALDIDAIKAIVPIQDGEERKLYEVLGGKLDDLDGGERPLEELEAELTVGDGEESLGAQEKADEEGTLPEPTTDLQSAFSKILSEPPPLLLAYLSVIAAFLTFGCVALGLYASSWVRGWIAKDARAWEVLGSVEKGLGDGGNSVGGPRTRRGVSMKEKGLIAGVVVSEAGEPAVEALNEEGGVDLINFDDPPPPDYSSDSGDEDLNEKFTDAEDDEHSTPSLTPRQSQYFPDPELHRLPSSASSSPYSTPTRRPLQMREIPSSASASPAPAWATLASASASTLDLNVPGGMPPSYAMQMPPSTGSGERRINSRVLPIAADPAWLVQLLVQALWGWMAVFVGGAR
ncbi:hypothetical protein JAAARDRAFT_72146 [Jaapia argillacea MUCL 33604]|uniref:Uncharacterized protein n=1 Tax=Jaapia argillacea MUCL 33604 TaxID=933084 RepID=A0A067PH15_9AGAM|nr:hypothetical protein JAAARDRAFT_72146 [Jaapia argillacea MUCL 33604]